MYSTTCFCGFCCENKAWPWVLKACLPHANLTHSPVGFYIQYYTDTHFYSIHFKDFRFLDQFSVHHVYSEIRVCSNVYRIQTLALPDHKPTDGCLKFFTAHNLKKAKVQSWNQRWYRDKKAVLTPSFVLVPPIAGSQEWAANSDLIACKTIYFVIECKTINFFWQQCG